jgi:hypothetical protein
MVYFRKEVIGMDDSVSSQPAPRTAAEYRAAIARLFSEMQRLSHQMHVDQAEIDRLRVESEDVKAEARTIARRTNARLDALEAMLAR